MMFVGSVKIQERLPTEALMVHDKKKKKTEKI